MSRDPRENLDALLDCARTAHLATLDQEGAPALGVAPFVRDDRGAFHVFLSGLASHTRDLLRDPRVAVMVTADEGDTPQPFARTRVTYRCVAEVVPREAPEFAAGLDALEERFGAIVRQLRGLGDFVLFRLVPQQGRFVQGFGQAFDLAGDGLRELRHVGPGGS